MHYFSLREIVNFNANVRWDDIAELTDAKRLLEEVCKIHTETTQIAAKEHHPSGDILHIICVSLCCLLWGYAKYTTFVVRLRAILLGIYL